MIVGVVGSGLMGSGIAQASAMAGYPTVVHDAAQPQIEKGKSAIIKSLAKLVEKGKLTAEQQAQTIARLRFNTDLTAVTEADLVVEAITEDLTLKNQLWGELDRRCRPATIFASNTSSLSIISMASNGGKSESQVEDELKGSVNTGMRSIMGIIRRGITGRGSD